MRIANSTCNVANTDTADTNHTFRWMVSVKTRLYGFSPVGSCTRPYTPNATDTTPPTSNATDELAGRRVRLGRTAAAPALAAAPSAGSLARAAAPWGPSSWVVPFPAHRTLGATWRSGDQGAG